MQVQIKHNIANKPNLFACSIGQLPDEQKIIYTPSVPEMPFIQDCQGYPKPRIGDDIGRYPEGTDAVNEMIWNES